MYPERMLKVEIVVLKSHAKQIVELLHNLGMVHLKLVEDKDDWIRNAVPSSELDELSKEAKMLRDVKAIARELGVSERGSAKYSRSELEQIIGQNVEINKLKNDAKSISKRIQLLGILRRTRITALPKSDRICVHLFETNPQKIKEIVLLCEEKNLDFEFSIDRNAGKGYIIIGGGRDDAGMIMDIAKTYGLIEMPLPKEEIADINLEIAENEKELARIDKNISHIEESLRSKLSRIISSVEEEYDKYDVLIERAKVISKFGESSALYFIEGWIRKSDKKIIWDAMEKHEKYAAISFHKPRHGELAPTSLKTPPKLKPFESLLTFVSIPRSDEIDPTWLIAITLPLIFGMIVGDIGYSIVLLAGSLYFSKKMNGILKDIMQVITYSSFWGILWGVVFGEFFGFELEYVLFGVHFPIINRLHGVMNLLFLTIALGAVHLMLGNALSAIEGIRHKDFKHALAKICWVALELGVIAMIVDVQVGGIISIISLLGIVATEGAVGIIEVPGLLANVMSYTRIAAVGLSGVILAFLINIMRPDPSQGLLMVLTVIAFGVGHFAAICLAAFESLIQGGRLHAVEFFSKFFKGGGIMFNPFRIKNEVK